MLLSEFDIIYVLQKAVKGQVIADQLADNPLPDYEPMHTFFPNEEVMFTTVLPIGFFKRSLDTSFYWSSQADHKFD